MPRKRPRRLSTIAPWPILVSAPVKMFRSLPPKLPRRTRGALDQSPELQKRNLRVELAKTRRGAEAAIGRGDDALAADEIGKADNALGDEIGVFDIIGRGVDDAREKDFIVRQSALAPERPFMVVARIGG